MLSISNSSRRITIFFKQKGISLAGQPYTKKLTDNITIKVMTGAVIPNNCDAVVMKEMVDIKNDSSISQKY
jgi:molybdopterin biosynthesis enzyme